MIPLYGMELSSYFEKESCRHSLVHCRPGFIASVYKDFQLVEILNS